MEARIRGGEGGQRVVQLLLTLSDRFSHLETIQKIYSCTCFSVTCWPPIPSGTLPGKLLWEERGEGAGLCADAAELSPQEGERLEPDPVEPGEVAGAPVS